MNCQQAEKLLPLYAGGDLEQKRELLVGAHVQTCATCAAEVDGFRTTALVLQELTPPAIGEDVYDEIRRQVWRRIEADSSARYVPRLFAGWFQPRTAWAVATIVVIAIMLTGAYLISNRHAAPRSSVLEIAGNGQISNPQTGNAPLNRQRDTPAKLTAGNDQGRSARRTRHFGPRVPAMAPRDSLAANGSDVAPLNVKPRLEEDSLQPSTESGLKNIRLEIQTSNPNIRIIWLSHPETKRSPNSKGI